MTEDLSEYEKARRDAYAPLVDRLDPKFRDKVFVFAISCGLGWKKIVMDLVEGLDKIWDGFQGKKGSENWQLCQMKEKFGGLRFYIDYPDPDLDTEDAKARRDKSFERISQAEALAWKTCERCGAEGKTESQGGQLATVCEPCEKRWKARRAEGVWGALFG